MRDIWKDIPRWLVVAFLILLGVVTLALLMALLIRTVEGMKRERIQWEQSPEYKREERERDRAEYWEEWLEKLPEPDEDCHGVGFREPDRAAIYRLCNEGLIKVASPKSVGGKYTVMLNDGRWFSAVQGHLIRTINRHAVIVEFKTLNGLVRYAVSRETYRDSEKWETFLKDNHLGFWQRLAAEFEIFFVEEPALERLRTSYEEAVALMRKGETASAARRLGYRSDMTGDELDSALDDLKRIIMFREQAISGSRGSEKPEPMEVEEWVRI